MEDLLIIEIPNFITHVELSKARRKKYFQKDDILPKKYQNDKYLFNKKGILVGEDNKPVVRNSRVAGTPCVKKINGQEFYSGNINPHLRAKMVSEMKKFFISHFEGIPPIDPKHFPLEMELELHYSTTPDIFDIDNLGWIYTKVIQDCLKDAGIIPEDNVSILSKSGGCQFVRVESVEERKLLVILRKNKYKSRQLLIAS